MFVAKSKDANRVRMFVHLWHAKNPFSITMPDTYLRVYGSIGGPSWTALLFSQMEARRISSFQVGRLRRVSLTILIVRDQVYDALVGTCQCRRVQVIGMEGTIKAYH